MRDVVLVLDDEPMIRTAVAVAVGATGRTVVTCADVESAQLVIERMPIRSVVTDMRLTGPFSDDGLQFIDFVTRNSPDSRVVLMTGSYSPELQVEARHRGAIAVLEKPFTSAQIDAVLMRDTPSFLSGEGQTIVSVPQVGQTGLSVPQVGPTGLSVLQAGQTGLSVPQHGPQETEDVINIPLLDDVLSESRLFSVFQPIVSIDSG